MYSTQKLFSDDELRRKDIDTLKRHFRHKLGGYTVAISDIAVSNILYRGVKCEERPHSITRISYPPPERVTKLGRVNREGQSVFYCSRGAPAVFYELHAKQGDHIALSEWELVEPLWMHNLGYHSESLQRLGAPREAMRSRLTNPFPNEPKEIAQLRRRIALSFTEDIRDGQEYRYKQSIVVNELLFDDASPLPTPEGGSSSSRAAGTVYPAMQMRGAADNIAIWPEFVDSRMRIKSVRYVLVETADEAASSYTLLTEAIAHQFSNNEIIWERVRLSATERRSRIGFENGNWVHYDGLNNILDLH